MPERASKPVSWSFYIITVKRRSLSQVSIDPTNRLQFCNNLSRLIQLKPSVAFCRRHQNQSDTLPPQARPNQSKIWPLPEVENFPSQTKYIPTHLPNPPPFLARGFPTRPGTACYLPREQLPSEKGENLSPGKMEKVRKLSHYGGSHARAKDATLFSILVHKKSHKKIPSLGMIYG